MLIGSKSICITILLMIIALNLNAQNLVLKSVSTGTAVVSQVTGTLSNATNVTVERYIPANSERAWRLLSVPTIGQTINAAWQEGQTNSTNNTPGYGTIITSATATPGTGYDLQQISSSLLTYNSGSNAWSQPSSTFNALATTSGYFLYIRGDRSQAPAPTAAPTNAAPQRASRSRGRSECQ